MIQLHFFCPEAINGAAKILDNRQILRCVARDSRREFYAVDAKAKSSHCVIPGFCTCHAFCYMVAAKPESILCKHELAVRLADAVGQLHTTELVDDEWTKQFYLAMALPMTSFPS